MRTIKFICFFFICSLSCVGQDKTDTETAKVFSFLINDKRNPLLSPQLDSFSLKGIYDGLLSNRFIKRTTIKGVLHLDTLTLTNDERDFIDSVMKTLGRTKWTSEKMIRKGLSNFKLTDKNESNKVGNVNAFVYQIMEPIFIRDKSICFVFYEYACGGLCGHGELSILIKKNGRWHYWENIYSIES